jgi:hypothetical protein
MTGYNCWYLFKNIKKLSQENTDLPSPVKES